MKPIPLSPIDHVFTGVGSYPIEFVFAYQETIDSGRLQNSLHETLVYFSPLRSKLIRLSDHAYGFRADNDGLLFETINSSSTFDDSTDCYEFLNSVDTVEDKPLTKIKLTQTPTGSVLGVSISHALVDGFSYFHFLSSWSRIFKGASILNPSHQRELLKPELSDSQKPVEASDVFSDCSVFWDQKRQVIARDQMVWERFLVSNDTMSEMLRKAQDGCDIRLSYNDVITAHLWKKYIGQWNESTNNPTTYVSIPFDFRRVLKTLPRTYFGCAICLATATMALQDLVNAPLQELARLIRKAISQVNHDYIWNSLKTLERFRRQAGLGAMEEIHVVHPNNGFLVTNISRLPVQNFEFGAGPPTGFEILTPAQRGAVVLPAQDGVDIRVCLPIDRS